MKTASGYVGRYYKPAKNLIRQARSMRKRKTGRRNYRSVVSVPRRIRARPESGLFQTSNETAVAVNDLQTVNLSNLIQKGTASGDRAMNYADVTCVKLTQTWHNRSEVVLMLHVAIVSPKSGTWSSSIDDAYLKMFTKLDTEDTGRDTVDFNDPGNTNLQWKNHLTLSKDRWNIYCHTKRLIQPFTTGGKVTTRGSSNISYIKQCVKVNKRINYGSLQQDQLWLLYWWEPYSEHNLETFPAVQVKHAEAIYFKKNG